MQTIFLLATSLSYLLLVPKHGVLVLSSFKYNPNTDINAASEVKTCIYTCIFNTIAAEPPPIPKRLLNSVLTDKTKNYETSGIT